MTLLSSFSTYSVASAFTAPLTQSINGSALSVAVIAFHFGFLDDHDNDLNPLIQVRASV
jgi:hypothetical protein